MSVELTFLGSGGFFAPEGNFHSNMILKSESGKYLLIDCGSDIRHSLRASGFEWSDIDSVYVSHLHDDHAGGLEALAFASMYGVKRRPNLICHESLVSPLWVNKLAISLMTDTQKTRTLKDYFKVKAVQKTFTWSDIKFKIVPAVHVVNHDLGHMYSFGLFINVKGYKAYITTDLSYSDYKISSSDWDFESHWRNYKNADIIFHECETYSSPSQKHAHYDFLNEFPKDIKKKMWLYHYTDISDYDAVADGFAGFVEPGNAFSLSG